MNPRTEVSQKKNKFKILHNQYTSQYKNFFLTLKYANKHNRECTESSTYFSLDPC